jgi:hypothetical protein
VQSSELMLFCIHNVKKKENIKWALNMNSLCSSENLACTYNSTRRYYPEDEHKKICFSLIGTLHIKIQFFADISRYFAGIMSRTHKMLEQTISFVCLIFNEWTFQYHSLNNNRQIQKLFHIKVKKLSATNALCHTSFQNCELFCL